MSNTMTSRERQEPELTLAELCGDSARMAPHWAVPVLDTPRPVPPSAIHGVVVPAASARLLDGTAEFGA
ncbi:hypothetical protein I3F58_19135 [Streptomyces sp. MUM 203J]|uniref:hypothetical protein n=1 Tax=Streptomyces sp. MUM 203J TaxID=2791990 RepID=UPI001F042B8E|nr:hypothetical protein [Streptomyces sp. MUM 203J]MCH0541638.1 hypothetical protein [Streptomyces sp. MUM 203J]